MRQGRLGHFHYIVCRTAGNGLEKSSYLREIVNPMIPRRGTHRERRHPLVLSADYRS